jgi:ribonuclease HI
VLIHPASGKRREISGASRSTTNNKMELTAVIEGLRALRRPTEVDIYSDSSYVVKGMTSWIHNWIQRGWKTSEKKPVLNEDLWRTLLGLVEGQKKVRFHWVPGHSGHRENERCDRLAVKAYQELLKRS